MIEELLRQERDSILAKLNGETAKIPWSELQRFFAGGNTLYVIKDLDLVDVAYTFHQDDVDSVKRWTDSGKVSPVSDDQARDWNNSDLSLWAIVVKPWVLVQSTED